MANRAFVLAVIGLWLGSMTWLFTERILPSLGEGQPPAFATLRDGETIAWEVEWAGESVGRAASIRVPGAGGSIEVHNRVSLHDIPIAELAPAWMRMAIPSLGELSFDVTSMAEFDSLGSFSSFKSEVSLNNMPSVVKMSGRVKDSYLRLHVNTGQLPYVLAIYLPDSKSLNEVLFPGAELPYMYTGRRWQEEVYSPFRASGDPVELVQVEVVGEEALPSKGEAVRVFRIEYHTMFGSGVSDKARLQAVTWVELTGRILRRDVIIGSSLLRFNRLSDEEADQLGKVVFAELLTEEHAESKRD